MDIFSCRVDSQSETIFGSMTWWCERYGSESTRSNTFHTTRNTSSSRRRRFCFYSGSIRFERNWFKFAKKPDITYYDKEKKEYILIDVTIVCDENINVAFARKAAKYNPLQQALIATLKAKSTKMIPVVLSISGLLNKKSKNSTE